VNADSLLSDKLTVAQLLIYGIENFMRTDVSKGPAASIFRVEENVFLYCDGVKKR
jgi:hypothetical protein